MCEHSMLTRLNSYNELAFWKAFHFANTCAYAVAKIKIVYTFSDRLIKCLCTELKWPVKSFDLIEIDTWYFCALNLWICRLAISFTQTLILHVDLEIQAPWTYSKTSIGNQQPQPFFPHFIQSTMTRRKAIQFGEKWCSKVHRHLGEQKKRWNCVPI